MSAYVHKDTDKLSVQAGLSVTCRPRGSSCPLPSAPCLPLPPVPLQMSSGHVHTLALLQAFSVATVEGQSVSPQGSYVPVLVCALGF